MSDFQLFWYPGTCARVPFVALEEIGEPYEVVVTDRILGDPGYTEVNPKGKVPALVADGRTFTENPAIHTYLSRRFPEAGLLPAGDPAAEIEALELMSWFAAGVHPPITRLRFPAFFCDVEEAHPSMRAAARKQLEECFAVIEDRLEGKEWLFDRWTIVDTYLLWLWFRATGSGLDGTQFPNCLAHARRSEARPSVATVLDREEDEFRRLKAAGRIPDFVPAYQAGRAPADGKIPSGV
jgi:glutathione S-transferase